MRRRRAGGTGENQIVVWPGLLDWRNQTLTPSADVTYVMPFFNTLAATTMLRVCVVPPNPRPLLAHGRAAAKQAGIPVSTIAFGTTRAPSTSRLRAPARARRQPTLHDPAEATGGSFPAAASAEALQPAYRDIGQQVGCTTAQHIIN